MSTLDTATASVTTEPTPTFRTFPVASPKSNHVMCCANEDVSLCAQDISALSVVETDEPSGCAVCDHLEQTDFCPLGLICSAWLDA